MFKFFQNLFIPKEAIQKVIDEAKQKAREIVLKANEDAVKVRQQAEADARKITAEAVQAEKELNKARSLLGQEKAEVQRERQLFEEEKKQIALQKQTIESVKKDIEDRRESLLTKLEHIASLTKEQAKDMIMRGVEDKMKEDVAKRYTAFEEEFKLKAADKAREMLTDAMRFGAVDYTAEYTLSVVHLPSDDYKGRIIGKDGRNIRAFELATGVDVDLDEEGVIKLSSFDAVRREVARVSLERLIQDGRIQPARIEEIVKKTQNETEKEMLKAGEDLCHKCGVYNLPVELMRLLGRFKYRFSYGQNMILHTLEETRIGIALAHELKCDVNTVKLGCLFHDIGKVIADKEGNHIDLGVEILTKYRFPQAVIDAVASHHEDVPFKSVEGVVVYIADAVSGSRPGARHEDIQQYVQRIQTIENIAKTKQGVKEAYALQAGRELRIIVRPDAVSDAELVILAQSVKDELEKQFEVFPGQITVTAIRESRVQATTKI
ncbi:MAG TPA: ribonuclease Y [Candidatus Woesebacteria bacterium]|nr:ribonuclease Y [Candidatus Woesebacteria bacterium]HNS94726.1 ribonuclease Y [Candidatus Woesebacteria bacterium]